MDMDAAEQDFSRALVDEGWWLASGIAGLYGWTHAFESLVQSVDRLANAFAAQDGAQPVHFPPVLNREVLVRSGYMQSFPDLCGSVHSFRGSDAEHQALMAAVEAGEDWGPHLAQTAVALTPAVCYPLYPTLAGTLGRDEMVFSLSSYVFRHEPSQDPARLQAFRMRENVCLGSADAVRSWRQAWMDRAQGLLAALGLPVSLAVANDPFFGRGGRMLRANQRQDEGKFEIVCPICSTAHPTAIASFNYHQDKFGVAFGIRQRNGEVAHSACIGFGLERCALAILRTHGLDRARWPAIVRRQLEA